MEPISITAEKRERSGKGAARATRRAGYVPGVIYGDKQTPRLISVDPRVLMHEMRKPGFAAQIYDISVDGTRERVVPRDVQLEPVKDLPIHVDFMRIGEKTELTAQVAVVFQNTEDSPGLKRGGVLNVVLHQVELVGRPDAFPDKVAVDISGLEVGQSVHVNDIALPEGVRPSGHDAGHTIATIVAPRGMKAAAAAGGG